jgi:hypothetical protein
MEQKNERFGTWGMVHWEDKHVDELPRSGGLSL